MFANPGVLFLNDARLVIALVERWRRETNTIFMRQGEMTVTSEDVGYLLGLPVQSLPIVGEGVHSNKGFFCKKLV